MGISKIANVSNVSMVENRNKKLVKKKEISKQRNAEKVNKISYNNLERREDRIKNLKQADEKLRQVKEKINDKESLKVMDKISNAREKVLSTLS